MGSMLWDRMLRQSNVTISRPGLVKASCYSYSISQVRRDSKAMSVPNTLQTPLRPESFLVSGSKVQHDAKGKHKEHGTAMGMWFEEIILDRTTYLSRDFGCCEILVGQRQTARRRWSFLYRKGRQRDGWSPRRPRTWQERVPTVTRYHRA